MYLKHVKKHSASKSKVEDIDFIKNHMVNLEEIKKEQDNFLKYMEAMKKRVVKMKLSPKERYKLLDELLEILLIPMTGDLRDAINVLEWNKLNMIYKYGMHSSVPPQKFSEEDEAERTRYIG